MRSRNALSLIVLIILLVGTFLFAANLQAINDWWRLRDYQPDSRIVKLADQTTMNKGTRRVFYINHPELDSKLEFNGHCRTTEQTIVLGCFIDNQGIYLLNVTDNRLDGVVEVTAAHETLHAMYARLSSGERQKVDKMTTSFFATLKDERIRKNIENYKKQDPSVVPNELHSILGTEVRKLSPELENYYKKYFHNRQRIVDYSDKYEKVFTDLEAKADNYDQQLASLKRSIDENEASINVKAAALDDKQQTMNAKRAGGDVEGYNAQVPVYNALVKDYNDLVNLTKRQIDEYNSLLNERNDLVIQRQQLYKSIDSGSINEKSRK